MEITNRELDELLVAAADALHRLCMTMSEYKLTTEQLIALGGVAAARTILIALGPETNNGSENDDYGDWN